MKNDATMTRIAVLVVLAAAAVTLTSCEELFFAQVPDSTPLSIFEQVWTFVDREYSFFDYKGIDWDQKYEDYRPLISNEMTNRELFDVLADMLFELKDGHVNLVSGFDRSRNWQWYLDADPNYDYSVLERYYFLDPVTGRSVHEYVGNAFILMDFADGDDTTTNGDVGYIHYRSFGSMVAEEDMDYVIDRFANHAGLIIDVRNNGGGAVSNVFTIADRLTDEVALVAQEQLKTGPGHDDFTPLQILALIPPAGRGTYTKPIVVLTNASCYSATNYFVTVVGELEHVTVMGDRTGGGGGIPAYTQLTNGWELRVSSGRLFTMAGVNVENGIGPDISVSSTEAELATGLDSILEQALTHIRAQ